jgi:hypothetical protein
MHWRDYKNRDKFQMWIPKLELSSLFLYLVGATRIRADIIDIDTYSDKDRQAPNT